ncbi:unnamed protein product [Amoebophrya sp. A120]|nr:unnamed protein product [Amoebophrya sp. A120]|eukprot:GSA120T00000516001.1
MSMSRIALNVEKCKKAWDRFRFLLALIFAALWASIGLFCYGYLTPVTVRLAAGGGRHGSSPNYDHASSTTSTARTSQGHATVRAEVGALSEQTFTQSQSSTSGSSSTRGRGAGAGRSIASPQLAVPGESAGTSSMIDNRVAVTSPSEVQSNFASIHYHPWLSRQAQPDRNADGIFVMLGPTFLLVSWFFVKFCYFQYHDLPARGVLISLVLLGFVLVIYWTALIQIHVNLRVHAEKYGQEVSTVIAERIASAQLHWQQVVAPALSVLVSFATNSTGATDGATTGGEVLVDSTASTELGPSSVGAIISTSARTMATAADPGRGAQHSTSRTTNGALFGMGLDCVMIPERCTSAGGVAAAFVPSTSRSDFQDRLQEALSCCRASGEHEDLASGTRSSTADLHVGTQPGQEPDSESPGAADRALLPGSSEIEAAGACVTPPPAAPARTKSPVLVLRSHEEPPRTRQSRSRTMSTSSTTTSDVRTTSSSISQNPSLQNQQLHCKIEKILFWLQLLLLLLLFVALPVLAYQYENQVEKILQETGMTREYLKLNSRYNTLLKFDALGLQDEEDRPRCPQALADQFVSNEMRYRKHGPVSNKTRARPDDWNGNQRHVDDHEVRRIVDFWNERREEEIMDREGIGGWDEELDELEDVVAPVVNNKFDN